MKCTHTHREDILYSENNGYFCTPALFLIYNKVNPANHQWDRWWNICPCKAWNVWRVFVIQIIHLRMSWRWSWISWTASLSFFLSLAAQLPELCYNQLCGFCHPEIESKGLKSYVFLGLASSAKFKQTPGSWDKIQHKVCKCLQALEVLGDSNL